MYAVTRKEVLLAFLLGEFTIRDADFDGLLLPTEEFQDHEALVACQHPIIGVDDRDFHQIKFLEALFQILNLLRTHDPRVLVVRDEF
jgi:hypothetical protein